VFITAKNESKGTVIAPRVKVATSLAARSYGLLGKASLPAGEGLWLKPCTSVHTFFMRFTIDVLFVDQEGVALSKATLPPWRISRWERRAAGVLELPAGTLNLTRTEAGDKISFQQN
jgi:uncharacterized membrane protein (UPF0127 family)